MTPGEAEKRWRAAPTAHWRHGFDGSQRALIISSPSQDPWIIQWSSEGPRSLASLWTSPSQPSFPSEEAHLGDVHKLGAMVFWEIQSRCQNHCRFWDCLTKQFWKNTFKWLLLLFWGDVAVLSQLLNYSTRASWNAQKLLRLLAILHLSHRQWLSRAQEIMCHQTQVSHGDHGKPLEKKCPTGWVQSLWCVFSVFSPATLCCHAASGSPIIWKFALQSTSQLRHDIMDFLEFSEARCKKINDGASYLKKQQKKT